MRIDLNKISFENVIFILEEELDKNNIFKNAIIELACDKKEIMYLVKEKNEAIDFFLEKLDRNVEISEGNTERSLYVTDNSQIAKWLILRNLAVLGYKRYGSSVCFEGVGYICEESKLIEDESGDGNEGEYIDAVYLEKIYRRYRNIPWDILQTDRCVLRETTVEDVNTFFEIYSEPDITKFTEGLYPTLQQEKDYIKEYIEKVYHFFEFGVWTVIEKEKDEIIGRAGLSVREGYDYPELGFVIAKKWQRKGIAFEICSQILKYAREEFEFDVVQALVEPGNIASVNLCERLGFARQKIVYEMEKEYILFIVKLIS